MMNVDKRIIRFSENVIYALAARTALRMLPYIQSNLSDSEDDSLGCDLLHVLRGVSLTFALAVAPERSADLPVLKIVENLEKATKRLIENRAEGTTRNAIAALCTAASCSFPRSRETMIQRAAEALQLAATTSDHSADEIERDLASGAEGRTGNNLACRPLWHQSQIPRVSGLSWKDTMKLLDARNEDWQVWTDWYDERLLGTEPNSSLEFARISLPEQLWEQEPAVVNAEIMQLIEEFQAQEPENVVGTDYETQSHQFLMDFAERFPFGSPVAVSGQVLTLDLSGDATDQQVARHLEIQGRYPRLTKNLGRLKRAVSERLGKYGIWDDLIDDCQDLHKLLDEGLVPLSERIGEAWELSVSIAAFVAQDNKLNSDTNSNHAPLPEDIRRKLDTFVSSFGPFLRDFPTAHRLDEQHRQWVADQQQIAAAGKLADTAKENELLEKRILDLLERALRQASTEDHQARKTAAWAVGSYLNIALTCVVASASTDVASGYFGHFGEELAKKSIEVLKRAEDPLEELLKNEPSDVQAAVRHVLRSVKRSGTTGESENVTGIPKTKPQR